MNKFSTLNIVLPKKFLVGAIIAKLPSSWSGYRKKILHKIEDIYLEEILKHLRIEEESCSRDKCMEESSVGTSKASTIEKPSQ